MSGTEEVELEVSIRVRVEYAQDAEGRVEVVAITPQLRGAPRELRVQLAELHPEEQRCLLRTVAAEAALRASEVALERQMEAYTRRQEWLAAQRNAP